MPTLLTPDETKFEGDSIVLPLCGVILIFASIIYSVQTVAEQSIFGIYLSAKLDDEMFENSNRFEERFMTPFITDVEILLETEDRIPVRPIPPNDNPDKIGDLIRVNTDLPEGKEAEEKVEVKKARGVKKKNKFNILPFLKGLVFSFDDLEEVEKNREKKRSKERSKEKSKEKGGTQVGSNDYK